MSMLVVRLSPDGSAYEQALLEEDEDEDLSTAGQDEKWDFSTSCNASTRKCYLLGD